MKKDQRPTLSTITVPRWPTPSVQLTRPVALSYWSLKRGQDLGYARADEPDSSHCGNDRSHPGCDHTEEPEEFVSDHTIRV